METGFALSQIDTATPHPARMYDALLGGKDNYAADRQAVRQLRDALERALGEQRAATIRSPATTRPGNGEQKDPGQPSEEPPEGP